MKHKNCKANTLSDLEKAATTYAERIPVAHPQGC